MKKVLAVLGFGICVLGIWWVFSENGEDSQGLDPAVSEAGQSVTGERGASKKGAFTFGWKRAEQCSYDLEYKGSTALPIFGGGGKKGQGGASVEVEINGGIVLRSYGKDGDSWLAGVSFTPGSKADYRFNGQSALPPQGGPGREQLGGEVLVAFNREGRVDTIRFPEGADPLFQNMVQMVLGDIQVTARPGQTAWTSTEISQHGSGVAQYTVDVSTDSSFEFVRTKDAYEMYNAVKGGFTKADSSNVDGRWKIDLTLNDGWARINTLSGAEEISLGSAYHIKTRVALDSVHCVPFTPNAALEASLRRAPAGPLGQVALTDKAAENLLRDRIGSMTAKQLADDLMQFGNSGRMPHHNRWLYEVTGLLKLRPELCGELVDLFEAPHLNETARGLVLDLLGNAGTTEAQAAMRDILRSETALGDRLYGMYLQRLTLLSNPDTETGDFLLDIYSSQEGQLRYASVNSLGAVAGRLAAHGNEADARRYTQKIISDLGVTEDATAQEAMLLGLGNVAMEEVVPVVAQFVDSDVARVRYAAATALRDVETPESRALLYGLVTDPEALVGRGAIHALRNYQVASEDLGALNEMVSTGSINEGCYAELIHLAQDNRHHSAAYRTLLEGMLAKGITSRDVEIRVRSLLKQP